MSEDKNKNEDWSIKDLNEIDRKNCYGFFALLLKVDRRINPHLYTNENNSSKNNADNA